MHSIEVEMCRQLLNYCLIYYLLVLSVTDVSSGDLFLVTPGDGEEFVYSPVDVNVTLLCAVTSMELSWEVGDLNFNTAFHRRRLHSRGIFQTETVTSSEGVTTSNVTVFGNLAENNGSELCCQSERDSIADIVKECTIIIIYGPPSPPELVPLQFHGKTLEINISWTALTVTGVDQNYTIYFDKEKVETIHSFYSYQQTTSDSKIRCSVYVTAVNGAGESDPSNNVTIPSLPDIGPVTASLSHQVWKSAGGEIMVNVSFKPALYCVGDPVLEYIITLMSDSEVNRDKITKILLGNNKTEVTIETSDGLKNNTQYLYKVTARNRIGNTTSSGKTVITSELQSVIATVVGESTIDIQCLFIHGSDAVGCKVVLVSECLKIDDQLTTVLRKNASSFSAEQSLKLMHNISCFQRVFAVDIDVNDTISNLTIEGRIFKPMTNGVNEGNFHLHIAIIIPATLIVFLFVVIVVTVLVIGHIKIRRTKLQNNHSENLSSQDKSDSSDQHLPSYAEFKDSEKSPPLNKLPKSLTHDQHETSYNSPSHNTISVQLTEDSSKNIQHPIGDVKKTSDATDMSQDVRVYAVPDKTKIKHKAQSNANCDNVEEKENEEEHIYHVLEKDQVSKEAQEALPDLQAPEPFGCSSSGVNEFPVYQDICEISMKTNTVNNDVKSDQLHETQTESKSQNNKCVRTSCAELQDNQGTVYSTPERSKVSS